MDDARGRRLTTGGIVQTPVAYLTCNFTPPATVDGQLQPSLFTHDEVTTLFHEFGHGLHHMLTEVDELSCRASRASNGMRSSCRRSSWKTSAGSGTCCRA
jgi:Zn-dependent oligopeptidase